MVAGKLQVFSLSYEYQVDKHTLQVLNELTFEINPGETFAIIGPSGCGKTTLLNLIAAFIPMHTGEILLNGAQVQKPSSERVLLSQEQDLFPWKTARDNVAFGLKASGLSRNEQQEGALKYLEMVGLVDFAGQYPHQLSGGMKQRVALARALAVEPAVMLMDEPFGALDAQSRQLLQEDLLRLWNSQETRPTTLLVTHDIDEAIYLADHIIVLSRRPAMIQELITVDLPKERTREHRMAHNFLTLKQRIWEKLNQSGETD